MKNFAHWVMQNRIWSTKERRWRASLLTFRLASVRVRGRKESLEKQCPNSL